MADPNAAAQQQPPASTAAPTTAATPAPSTEQPQEQQEQRDLAPGGSPCNTCGVTFRTPEELKEHESKNAGKEREQHVQ